MNENLKEIAEESGMTQYVSAENKYLERFAESLVNDIIDIILYKSRVAQVHEEHDMVAKYCELAETIRDNYGVE